MKTTNISDSKINAYIDGELSPEQHLNFQKELQHNSELNQLVCEARKIKQQVQEAYMQTEVPPMPKAVINKTHNFTFYSKVASFSAILLTIGFIWGQFNPIKQTLPQQKIALANQNQILMHIDTNNPLRVKRLLKQVTFILSNEPGKKVEIVANSKGIELFDQKNNPYKKKILNLLSQYGNLKLLACQRALARRATAGNPIHTIKHVETDRPALDEIVKKIREGWQYQKI